MKIGILTHPQAINYGGILQCYALSTFLEKMGHTVFVIRRGTDMPLWKYYASKILRMFKIRNNTNRVNKAKHINSFSEKYLHRTKNITSQNAMQNICRRYKLDAVIVGSDQVWRADFALNYGFNYFLDFVPDKVKKISYAASFGLSTWDYTTEQTCIIRQLLDRFDGLSVREEDAVDLIKENIGLDVVQMPDPTLVLSATDYEKVSSPRLVDDKYVFVYWLGEKSLVEDELDKYKKEGFNVIYVGLRENRELPSIEDWLSYICYADIVLTDSFHGCVFSILFKRELYAFANKSGGIGRVASLFRQFGVDGYSINENDYLNSSVILNDMQGKANKFLKRLLS